MSITTTLDLQVLFQCLFLRLSFSFYRTSAQLRTVTSVSLPVLMGHPHAAVTAVLINERL